MKESLSVSIALCTYNGERFLSEQLETLVNQTVLPEEVVIADDGSRDATLSIAEKFAQIAPFRVQVLTGRVGGPTQNFERALSAASGDVVLFCDQDDLWYPDKVEEFVSRFQSNPGLICVFCDARLVDERGRHLGATLWDTIGFGETERRRLLAGSYGSSLLKSTIAFGLTMGLHKRLVAHISPIPMPFGHDNFCALIASAMGEFDLIEKPLLDYRQHSSQVSGAGRLKSKRPTAVTIVPNSLSYSLAQERINSLPARSRGPYYESVRTMVEEKSKHLEFRENLPKQESRFRSVYREWSEGRYEAYSNGWLSVVKDLLRN